MRLARQSTSSLAEMREETFFLFTGRGRESSLPVQSSLSFLAMDVCIVVTIGLDRQLSTYLFGRLVFRHRGRHGRLRRVVMSLCRDCIGKWGNRPDRW